MSNKTSEKKGFVIIIVTSIAALFLIIATTIIVLGCEELRQTRAANDREAAYYIAFSGAEIMYNLLKSQEGQTVTWPQTVPAADSVVRTRSSGGTAVGAFSASADTTASGVFGIVSRGVVNNRDRRITVKYGFDSSYTNGYPIGCGGAMSLKGSNWWVLRSWVRAEGPLASGSTISTNNFVKISGDMLEHQSFAQSNFWWSYDAATTNWTQNVQYDTTGDGQYLTDATSKGYVDISDAGGDPVREAIFQADDINSDGRVDDKDAFTHYYTVELNKQGLNIGEGQTCYYSGDQTFDPTSVPAGTRIIFVDGTANIFFNSTSWWGQDSNHTIVATGDINIVQPTNNSNDTLTLVSYGDINTGGVRAFGGVRGDLSAYANEDFNAYYGGRTNGTIFADGNVNIDTVLAIPGLLNRDVNKGTINWEDPDDWPLGLPQNFNRISSAFTIQDEYATFIPVWNRE